MTLHRRTELDCKSPHEVIKRLSCQLDIVCSSLLRVDSSSCGSPGVIMKRSSIHARCVVRNKRCEKKFPRGRTRTPTRSLSSRGSRPCYFPGRGRQSSSLKSQNRREDNVPIGAPNSPPKSCVCLRCIQCHLTN